MKINDATSSSGINNTEAEILLSILLNKDRSFLISNSDYKLNIDQQRNFSKMVQRRKTNEPIAYISGHKEFYGLNFYVNKSVMIPRPETEDLVDALLQKTKNERKKLLIADVGTGSGCIAITLARLIDNIHIYAIDIDRKALAIARRNAHRNKVETKITFVESDLLSSLPKKMDFMIANLPYIKAAKIKDLQPEIKDWEPEIALNGGTDGMALYKQLFSQARNYLNNNGSVFYEIDGRVFIKKFTDLNN